ncbi:hypothetical protein [Shewanella sp.]|uniref:hypothetical protein n=1 Tax=Shewanella sp. TaxID=50422 RepID=UPI0035674987
MNTENIIQHFSTAARYFRLGQEAFGSQLLRLAIDDLLSAADENHYPTLGNTLAQALAEQQRQDWFGLADTLEYELIEVLKQPQSKSPS